MGDLPLTCDWAAFFYYDESSPSGLKWKVNRYRGKDESILFKVAGEDAGRFDKESGYWRVNVNYQDAYAHRVVFLLHHGYMPEFVDHFDRNRSNNAIGNLRPATSAINTRNMSKSVRNTSGVCGVNLETIKSGSETYMYWRVTVQALDGSGSIKKNFSVAKLGYDEAFRQACDYRAAKIEELNQQGAGYTDDHGIR